MPKLEQLIVSRLRAALQDKLVHPHHISLALPRILTPSISSTPLINDLGESAVDAMSDALRKGVSQMVDDLVGVPIPDEHSAPSTSAASQVSATVPTSPRSPKSPKKIVMPAGFPGYTPSLGNTPLVTPQPRRTQPPSSDYASQAVRPSAPSMASSSARGPLAPPSATESSQFRFRGQFASQPATPGYAQAYDQRRVGALNAQS